ncbi:hypothetical protein BDQ12DRAFT_599838 [Crucibulum laeve]|uniref:Uncharacterized protein n=1 Tax=Crucibulum laeve TaxID=68775 RepID=A0A5C3MA10_9AGAR|nr:hypothetical protein BDQ12DRAFT_599838 [Crucibulum laeve]
MAKVVSSNWDVFLYFVAILIPPVPVFLSTFFVRKGLISYFWINILLCILGWIPGVIHAWYEYSYVHV